MKKDELNKILDFFERKSIEEYIERIKEKAYRERKEIIIKNLEYLIRSEISKEGNFFEKIEKHRLEAGIKDFLRIMEIIDLYYFDITKFLESKCDINKIKIDNKLLQDLINYISEFHEENKQIFEKYSKYSINAYISIFLSILIYKSGLKNFEINIKDIYPFFGSMINNKKLIIKNENKDESIGDFIGYKSIGSTFIIYGKTGLFIGAYSSSSKFFIYGKTGNYKGYYMVDGEINVYDDEKY